MKSLLAIWINDHAKHRKAIKRQGYRDAPLWIAARKVYGAINRINDPCWLRQYAATSLLAEKL